MQLLMLVSAWSLHPPVSSPSPLSAQTALPAVSPLPPPAMSSSPLAFLGHHPALKNEYGAWQREGLSRMLRDNFHSSPAVLLLPDSAVRKQLDSPSTRQLGLWGRASFTLSLRGPLLSTRPGSASLLRPCLSSRDIGSPWKARADKDAGDDVGILDDDGVGGAADQEEQEGGDVSTFSTPAVKGKGKKRNGDADTDKSTLSAFNDEDGAAFIEQSEKKLGCGRASQDEASPARITMCLLPQALSHPAAIYPVRPFGLQGPFRGGAPKR
ncbi:hypothetical protein V8E36_009205 [Tilletia maclaganii]